MGNGQLASSTQGSLGILVANVHERQWQKILDAKLLVLIAGLRTQGGLGTQGGNGDGRQRRKILDSRLLVAERMAAGRQYPQRLEYLDWEWWRKATTENLGCQATNIGTWALVPKAS